MAPDIPTGTVTFVFTDIEGSARLAREHRDVWESLRERHDAILRSAVEAHRGHVFQIVGDAFCCAFHTVREGVVAAVEAQQHLQTEPWATAPICVRIGLHTGEAQAHAGDYRGYLTLTRAQRVMSVAHGGQILLSNASAELVRDEMPARVTLRDMGEHRLKSLPNPERLWQVIASGMPEEFPPLASLNAIPNNLPLQLTSLVGREKEIAEVRALLQAHRLVTLTGAGGTGKTRLALQVAAEVLDAFKDGVWFIELASLSDAELLPNSVASVLSIREIPGRPLMTTLVEWLHARQALFILDNCEHLVEACAAFANTALHAAPAARILVTSRETLGVSGEVPYRVPSLETPEPAQASRLAFQELQQYTAIRLFNERAREAVASFHVMEANASAVAQICHRLDGIPLAIELAAARVKVLGVQQIAQRLDDRFRLLTGGSRTSLPRHQTLRSTLDWSYSLLTDHERVLFRRLSVFAGGWTLEAAEYVCRGDPTESCDILDLLTRLVDKSLVVVDQGVAVSRYRMLESIREYARGLLIDSGDAETVRQRQLDYYLGLAEEGYARQYTDSLEWLGRLETEHDNLRAALDWAHAHDRQKELELAGELAWFWTIHSHLGEGRKRLGEALRGHSQTTPAVARALVSTGSLALSQGDYDAALAFLESGLAIWRELDERSEMAGALEILGEARMARGAYVAAQACFDENLAIARELGDPNRIDWALLGVGQAQWGQKNYAAGRSAYDEAYAIAVRLADRRLLQTALHCLADVALFDEDYGAARARYAEALKLAHELGDTGQVRFELEGIGMAAAGAGEPVRALHLGGVAIAIAESLGSTLTWDWWEAAKERWFGQARRELGEKAAEAAWSEGRAMSMDQAISFALEQEPGKPGRTKSPV